LAQRTLSRVRGRFASSFMAIMAIDRVLRIEQRINRLAARRMLAFRFGMAGLREIEQ
jgi:hypothetical protein